MHLTLKNIKIEVSTVNILFLELAHVPWLGSLSHLQSQQHVVKSFPNCISLTWCLFLSFTSTFRNTTANPLKSPCFKVSWLATLILLSIVAKRFRGSWGYDVDILGEILFCLPLSPLMVPPLLQESYCYCA